jgi:hypothetical protein
MSRPKHLEASKPNYVQENNQQLYHRGHHHVASQPSHHHASSSLNSILILSLLVDGVGLAMIAGCTILEGFDLWIDFFNEHWEANSSSLGFWLCGRFLQLSGLLLLIIHAASFQMFHEFEQAGMMMLTVGPILNICACSLFDNEESDPYHLYNKQWLASESLELIGISVLDVSMIDDLAEIWVLVAEVAGFIILQAAAVIEFEFIATKWLPYSVIMRADMIHMSDCFGLGMLTVVSFLQYHMKTSKASAHSSTSHHRAQDHKD